MAKALLGHVGVGIDPRLTMEVRRLQLRVRDLEAELARCRRENDVLVAAVAVVDSATDAHNEDTFDLREPALT